MARTGSRQPSDAEAPWETSETLGRDRFSTTFLARGEAGEELVVRRFDRLPAGLRDSLPFLWRLQRSLRIPGLIRPTELNMEAGPAWVHRPGRGQPLSHHEFTLATALRCGAGIAELLAALHHAGVYGVELKPERLLVEASGRPSFTGLVASPELWGFASGLDVLLGAEIDPRIDLPAYAGVLRAIIDRVRPVAEAESDVLSDLGRLIEGLESPEPADRPELDAVLAAFASAGVEVTRPPATPRWSPRLVGREVLLRELESILSRPLEAEASSGVQPVLMALTGRAGGGKSRVAAALAARSRDAGATVLAVESRPGDRRLLGPLADCLSEARVELAAPDAGSDRSGLSPEGERRRGIEQAVDRLVAARADQPTLLLVEDVDELPAPALAAISYLVREVALEAPASVRLAVVVTLRAGDGSTASPASTLIEEMREEGFAERVRLPPLDLDGAHELLDSLGVERRRTRDRLAGAAAGNPRHLVELARLCHERDGEAAELEPDDTLRRRLESTDERERKVLEAMAILDRPIDLGQLQPLLPARDRVVLLGTILRLAARGWLVPAAGYRWRLADRWAASHVRETISSRRARHLHRQAARAAEVEEGADPAVLARHAELGGERAGFLVHGRRAAEELASAHRNDEALGLFERVLAATPRDDPSRVELTERCAALRGLVGDFDGAIRGYRDLLELPHEPGRTWQIYKALGRAHRENQQQTEAAEAFDLGLASLGEGQDLAVADLLSEKAFILCKLGDGDTARGLAEMAGALTERMAESQEVADISNRIGAIFRTLGDLERAVSHIESGLHTAEKVGALELASRARNNLGNLIGLAMDRPQRGLEHCLRSLEIQERLGDRQLIARTAANIGALYLRSCDLEKAEKYLQIGLGSARRFGRSVNVMLCLANLAELEYLRARYGEALELRLRVLKLAERLGRARDHVGQLFGLCRDYLTLGSDVEAERYVRQLEEGSRRREDPLHEALAGLARAGIARLRREPAAARELLQDAEELLREIGAHEPLVIALLERAELELLDAPEITRQAAEEATAVAGERGHHRDRAFGLLLLAEASLSADTATAERHLREAAGISGELDQPELSWRCELLAGQLARRRGDTAGARRRFHLARELLEQIVQGVGDPELAYCYMRDRRRIEVLRRAREATGEDSTNGGGGH